MKQFFIILKYSLSEQLSNKLALLFLAAFVPAWYWVMGIITPNSSIAFKFSPIGAYIHADGHQLILITAGLNMLAILIGFLFFHSTHLSLAFDRRLTRAGINRLLLVCVKTVTQLIITALAAGYMSAILLIFWHFPNNVMEIWLGFWFVSLTYGSLGRVIGMATRTEIPGLLFIVIFGMVDTFLQNPLGNPAANKPFLQFFPSYAAMQLSVAGGFTNIIAGKEIILALSWFCLSLTLTLIVFSWRTRRISYHLKYAPVGRSNTGHSHPVKQNF